MEYEYMSLSRYKEEFCAKVILARGGESEIKLTIKPCQPVFGTGYCVQGSVPGGAYAKLQTLVPGQLQRLCDNGFSSLSGSDFYFVEYRDSQSGATVQDDEVRWVLGYFQKYVKEYPAARVILALNNQDGVSIQQSAGREKAVSSSSELAGGGAYEHLQEMVDKDPILLQKLIDQARFLLKGAEQGTRWRDGESDTAVIVMSDTVLGVCRDLQEVLQNALIEKNSAAEVILGVNNESGITIKPWGSHSYRIKGELAGEGAFLHLIKMSDDNPVHLHSLLETAETSLQEAALLGTTYITHSNDTELEQFYCMSLRTVTQPADVLIMCRDLQRDLMNKRGLAANVILYLGTEGRDLTLPLSGQVDIDHIAEGAYNDLIEMANEDPAHLYSLLERAKPYLQEAETKELTWRNGDSESAVVAHNHVSQWYQGLQEGLQKRADVAAKVMLAISKESGFTTRPSRGGEEVVSSDGKLIQERDYNLLRKMVHEEPTHFHQLLSATERLLLDFDAQQVWRDDTSGVCIKAVHIQHVWEELLQLYNQERKRESQSKRDLAAKLLLGNMGRRAVTIRSLPSQANVVYSRGQDEEGGETYEKLKDWAQKNPKHICRLLRAGKSLLKNSPSDQDWRDRSSTTHLTVDDLETVYEELFEIQDKWQKLALKLGLSIKVVDRIKASNLDHASCLRETVNEWLTESPEPSWQNLVDALRSPTVGEYQLARRLEEKYFDPKGVCLKQDDLCTIHTELYPARLKWYDLGLKLGVSVAVLNQIRQMFSSPSDCLLEVLQHWLQSSPHPTWEEMCTALRSRTVGEHPLAQQLEEVFVPVADSGAEDGASSSGSQSDSEDLSPSELREPLLAIMEELQTLAETSQHQGGRREERSTSQGKEERQDTPGVSSGDSGLSGSDHSSDQECSPPPVKWELEAKLVALKEALARIQQEKFGRQQSTGDCERRHGTPNAKRLKLLSDRPGPSRGPIPRSSRGASRGPSDSYLFSSDDSPTLTDQECSPRTCKELEATGRAQMSGRKRSAGGDITAEGTPPAKHLKMSPSITAPKQNGTASSGQATQQYARLFTRFDQLIEMLADTTRAEDLADKLLRERLITKGYWEEACLPTVTDSKRIRRLIRAVLSQVKLNPANYDKFVSALRELDGLQDIVQMIEGV